MSLFWDKLKARCKKVNNLLCVGLDPPSDCDPYNYCTNIIDATIAVAAAYKLNIAYFEQFGPSGMDALLRVRNYISDDIPTILDAKRADIFETATAYARAIYGVYNFDATTICGYMGSDAIKPFLREDKAIFILCKTSNSSASELQELILKDGRHVYEAVADSVLTLGENIGLVMGATDVVSIEKIRKNHLNTWFLVPGVGAQGGSLDQVLKVGLRSDGLGLLINVGRGISQAENPRVAAEQYAEKLKI